MDYLTKYQVEYRRSKTQHECLLKQLYHESKAKNWWDEYLEQDYLENGNWMLPIKKLRKGERYE